MTPAPYPCPSCGFLVFDEPAGSYAICGLCGWEDDPVQLQHPMMRGGANTDSLMQYQLCSIERWPLSVTTLNTIERDAQWRPFELTDARTDVREVPRSGREYFDAVLDDSPSYYWRR